MKSIAFVLFLLVAIPLQAAKRALIIGIGTYEDVAWNKIHGDRDVPLVEEMLKSSGFHDIKTLVNQQATKKSIVAQFQQLIARCQPGDVVYIHFSGHGQRMTDLNGDEDDGWDEAWIPYDARLKYGNLDHGEKHLSDDEIGRWLTQIRQRIGNSGQILVVVDACHSGDSSRGLDTSVICVRGVFNEFVIPQEKDIKPQPKIREDWITLSACKSYQLNSELPSQYGRLTYVLYQNREHLVDLSNADLLQLATDFMEQTRQPGMMPQTPIMTGSISTYAVQKIFEK